MTATNIFYNFVGFRYTPPLKAIEVQVDISYIGGSEVGSISLLDRLPETATIVTSEVES